MSERRNLGDILTSAGRLSDKDVARALDYQREHGGYFGEALLACGLLSPEELEWSLASQFDLPYVFPDADSIDMEAASLVSPEWALAHLTLPIMKSEGTLTVVVESPVRTAAVDELEARTDLTIELALASASNIREMIQQVFSRNASAEEGVPPKPIQLKEALHEALSAAAPRFGISTRGPRSWIWWDDAGATRRRPLEGMWEAELEHLVEPPPRDMIEEASRATWNAYLNRDGVLTSVEVRYMADDAGHEYLFRPVAEHSALLDRFPPPGRGILSEVRMLARSGSARFVVTTQPATLGRDILPHLPALLLDPSWRSIHVHSQEGAVVHEVFSLALPSDHEGWAMELEALRAFRFDVITVDLPGYWADWIGTALDVASVAFLLWPASAERRPAHDAGIRWDLRIVAAEDGRLEWSLEPLNA